MNVKNTGFGNATWRPKDHKITDPRANKATITNENKRQSTEEALTKIGINCEAKKNERLTNNENSNKNTKK